MLSQVRDLERDVDRVPGEVMDNEDMSTKEKLGHIDSLMKRLQVPTKYTAKHAQTPAKYDTALQGPTLHGLSDPVCLMHCCSSSPGTCSTCWHSLGSICRACARS